MHAIQNDPGTPWVILSLVVLKRFALPRFCKQNEYVMIEILTWLPDWARWTFNVDTGRFARVM